MHERQLMLLSSNDANPRPDPELIVPSLFGTTGVALISTAVHGKRELPQNLLPPIAIIKDPMDPASVRYVAVKELPQQIDEGVTLQKATLEIVDDGIFLLKNMGLSGSQPKATFMSQFPWTKNRPAFEEFFKRLIATGFNPGTSVELSTLVSR